jgi:hypothetical protein
MDPKSSILLESINLFFRNETNSKSLVDIIEKQQGISLRHLEWFITNYSKTKNLTYTTKTGKLFTVHCAYKSTLDGYSKKLFDPFCRAYKIDYEIPNSGGVTINTTVAQLNFIRWCITNNIIEYIIKNKENLKNMKKNAPPPLI